MRDKVCLITGATSGIGLASAEMLAQRGARLVMVARDPARGAAAAERLRRQSENAAVEVLLADLSAQAQVRRLAREFRARHGRLDVLVNNAGAIFLGRRESADGIEMTFALNHLAYFLLTTLLLDLMRPGSRIVVVASDAHRAARMRFDDLEARRRYFGWRTYAQSKLANVLFTYELSRRLEGTGITANAMHPGTLATRFGFNNGTLGRVVWGVVNRFVGPAEHGARTVAHLAASPEVEGVSGRYFVDQHEARSSRASYDRAAAERLWRVSEEMTAP